MKTIISICLILGFQAVFIFNFKTDKDFKYWRIVNDGVMGGLSTSKFYKDNDGYGVFEGVVSLENNGGFAMVQYNCNVDVNSAKYIVMKIKGDGKTYQLRIKDKRNTYYSYVQNFKTTGNNETITLNLSDFQPYFRGRKLQMTNFNDNQIEQIAILIGNKKEESFKLSIESISLK